MAVKVKRERADQRRHHRVTAPLFVDVLGHRIRVADWSLGGLKIDDFPAEIPAHGEQVPLHLTLPFQGFDVSFDVMGDVVRSDPGRQTFALNFLGLGERERELMSHFLEELVRGSMVDVEDTIQRIDVPVTPASLEPDVIPALALRARRWPVKTVLMSGMYAVLGIIVFGYAALLTYSNFFRLEVQTAVISAPVETVAAQAEGRVHWAGLKPGDGVAPGAVILKLSDNQLEREIELADIAIRERKAQLVFLKRRQADEIEKVQGYANVELRGVQQNRIEIEGLLARLKVAESQHHRLNELHQKGYTTTAKLDEAEKEVATLSKQLEGKRVELKSRIELAESNVGKRYYNGNEMVGDIVQIEAQARLAEHEIALHEQKHQALLNHRDRLAVRAPFEGTLLELPHLDNSAVKRGDTVAVIEQRRQRQVTAFLSQEEVLRVGLGDEAQLYLPALNETLKARVLKIDRTSGFIEEQHKRQGAGYRWRDTGDRTANVTLAFSDPDKVRDWERYRSGLPVVVVFPQRTTNSLMASIRRRISLAL